jgi:hypothetical protein
MRLFALSGWIKQGGYTKYLGICQVQWNLLIRNGLYAVSRSFVIHQKFWVLRYKPEGRGFDS